MTGHIHSSSRVCVKTLSEEDEEEKKRRRRKKDLANASVVQKPQSKKKKKFNCHICRLEPQLQCAASVSKEAEELRWAPTCAALVQTPLKGRGSQVRFVLMEKRKGAQNGCH